MIAKKEKIYIVTTIHPFDDVRIFFREIKTLEDRYEVIYLAPGARNVKDPSFKMIDLVPGSGLKNRLLRNIKTFIYLYRERPEILHFHDFEFSFFAILLKIFKRTSIIFDKHEFTGLVLDNRSWVPKFIKPLIRLLILIQERIVDYFADEIIVANPLQLKKNQQATLLMNLPPRDHYKNYYSKKNFNEICYVGDITPSRGGWRLLEIIDRLPKDYKLYLVGRIRDNDLAKKIKANKKIKYLGYIPNNQIYKKLKSVGIGIIPFLDKPQYRVSVPSKYFDYLGMGMLVLAPIFVKDSFGGKFNFVQGSFFVDGSVESFTNALLGLEKIDSNRLSQENRNLFINCYNWESESLKLLSVYEKIINRSKN